MTSSIGQEFVFGALFALLTVVLLLLARRQPQVQAQALMELWNQRIASMPQHADLGHVYDRLGAVERGIEGIRGEMRGVQTVVERQERYVKMLVDHNLERDK